MRTAALRVLFHGSIVLGVGLLCGIPYGQAITGGWGEDAVRGWHVAHIGITVGGIWLIAVAGALPLLVLDPGRTSLLVWTLVASGYGFSFALVLAPASGVRGLELALPLANVLAFLGNAIAALASLVAVALLVIGARAALRDQARP